MVAWAMRIGSSATDGDWFARRFAHARALIRAADFDTVIPADFGETITCELVDVVGVADANPVSFYNGGVVEVPVGDAVIAPSRGRLQLTQPPSHVGLLSGKSWYVASLVRVIRPPDAQIGATAIDAIGLWGDDNNRIGLGILGNASGGSTTNWVGYAVSAASFNTAIGPALDGEESPVWHLFEAWFDVGAGLLSFAIDGVNFATTIAAADVPAVPATLSMITQRDAIGDEAIPNYDKACVVVASPAVGASS